MNRFLGLSGVVHIGLITGLLYVGAKNDFSPHKVIESLSFEAFGGEGRGEQAELKVAIETPVAPAAPVETVRPLPAKFVAKASALSPASSKMKTMKIIKSAKATPAVKASPVDDSADVELDESVVDEAIAEVKSEVKNERKNEVQNKDNKSEKVEESNEEENQALAAVHEQEVQKQADLEAQQEADAANAKKVALLKDLRKQNANRDAKDAADTQAAPTAATAATGLGSSDKGEGPNEGETVHALSEFKQIGGNPKPKYDSEDRMKGRAGVVTFQAFVQKDGSLNDFQLVESSGHRTLDAKTLQSLKKWKFASGQEGWIEIPFQWDLKGGAQEVSPLRTSRSATK